MALRNFESSSKRNQSDAVNNPIDIEFELAGEPVTAHPPTTGQMTLFIIKNRAGGIDSIESTFQFLADILDDDDYATFEAQLHGGGIDIQEVIEIVNYLIEEWSARPTGSSSGSSSSRKTTGRKSTAKRASAKAKT